VSAPALDPRQPLEPQVRRLAEELLGDAERRLRLPGPAGWDGAVHESRKRVKEVRALLRLLRETLVSRENGHVRPWANEALRSAARPLGPAREAAVAVETLDELGLEGADSLRNELVRRHREALAGDLPDVATDAATRISHVRQHAGAWGLAEDGWDAISPGIKRIHKRGRKAMRKAVGSGGDVELWHDWRKRAKDLRYCLEFLIDLPGVEDRARAAKRLTKHLGRDHDLAELLENTEEADDSPLALRVAADRAAEQAAAIELGEAVYADKKKAFLKEIERAWLEARRGAAGLTS